jgi:hypothetical protein
MSQFDIHANPFARSRKRQPFLVILQGDLIDAYDLGDLAVLIGWLVLGGAWAVRYLLRRRRHAAR